MICLLSSLRILLLAIFLFALLISSFNSLIFSSFSKMFCIATSYAWRCLITSSSARFVCIFWKIKRTAQLTSLFKHLVLQLRILCLVVVVSLWIVLMLLLSQVLQNPILPFRFCCTFLRAPPTESSPAAAPTPLHPHFRLVTILHLPCNYGRSEQLASAL